LIGGAWLWFDGKKLASIPKRGFSIFILIGISTVLAHLSLFSALDQGNVVIVSPIIVAQPLFVIPLAALFLRGMERITPMMVAGGVLIVLGGAFIGIG
jgi:uncharacterized membrane protein